MYFCYKDPSPYAKKNSGFNPDLYDSNKQYKIHYYNFLVLTFIVENSDDFQEKARANYEIEVCKRKIKFAENFRDFNKEQAANDAMELKAAYRTGEQ